MGGSRAESFRVVDGSAREVRSTITHGRLPASAAVAVNLAVTTTEFGGDGWESNPPRTLHSAPQTVLKTLGVVLNTDPARKGP